MGERAGGQIYIDVAASSFCLSFTIYWCFSQLSVHVQNLLRDVATAELTCRACLLVLLYIAEYACDLVVSHNAASRDGQFYIIRMDRLKDLTCRDCSR